ncbi:MAG: hypothetical protein KBD01_17105 [Acidobacteria bacterium]|nr:hypothetical protein [Acidobacteriota bacterium]
MNGERPNWVACLLLLASVVLTLGAVAQRLANIRNSRISMLPSSDLMYELAVLAILFLITSLLWEMRGRLR